MLASAIQTSAKAAKRCSTSPSKARDGHVPEPRHTLTSDVAPAKRSLQRESSVWTLMELCKQRVVGRCKKRRCAAGAPHGRKSFPQGPGRQTPRSHQQSSRARLPALHSRRPPPTGPAGSLA